MKFFNTEGPMKPEIHSTGRGKGKPSALGAVDPLT